MTGALDVYRERIQRLLPGYSLALISNGNDYLLVIRNKVRSYTVEANLCDKDFIKSDDEIKERIIAPRLAFLKHAEKEYDRRS